MQFSRLGEHTIKCVITEDEIFDMGYTLDDIMSNGERTQEFMNLIFDKAEQEFQTKFDIGIKTVRADFLPNHSLSLIFSEHPASGEMVEHLKDIVSGMLNSIPAEKWEEIKTQMNKEKSNHMEDTRVIALIVFEDLDTVVSFSKHVSLKGVSHNALYKENDKYYLIMDLSEQLDEEIKALSLIVDEYASEIQVGVERQAHIEELGTVIIKDHAIEKLRQI